MKAHISFQVHVFFYLDWIYEEKLISDMEVLFLFLRWNFILFSRKAASIYIAPNSEQGLSFPYIFTISYLIYYKHPNRCGMITHCSINLHFSEHLLCLTSHLLVLFHDVWGKKSKFKSCTWFNIHIHAIGLHEFLKIYFGYLLIFRYMICKYFILFGRLHFIYFFSVLCHFVV